MRNSGRWSVVGGQIALFLVLAVTGSGQKFDTSIDRLPAGFRGHDIARLWAPLVAAGSQGQSGCDQFEKDAECRQRMTVTLQHLPIHAVHAFSMPNTCEYRAEQEVFHCRSNTPAWFEPGYVWKSVVTGTGSYIASNAFGVKKRVRTRNVESRYLRFIGTPRTFATEKIPPMKAREIYDDLRVLMIGSFTSPFVVSGTFEMAPTLSSPFKLNERYQRAYFELSEVWVYNIRTGAIHAKYEV